MDYIYNLFWNMLMKIGLWKKKAKIVFLGLDNSGKTTLMNLLKTGKVTQADPTKHAHQTKLTIGNVNINAFDLGGHQTMRNAWKNYFPKLDAIIYIVDTADKVRF